MAVFDLEHQGAGVLGVSVEQGPPAEKPQGPAGGVILVGKALACVLIQGRWHSLISVTPARRGRLGSPRRRLMSLRAGGPEDQVFQD